MKQHTADKQRLIERCNAMIQAETDRMAVELEAKLQEQREQLEVHLSFFTTISEHSLL